MPLSRDTISAAFEEHAARIAELVPGARAELSGSALVEDLDAEDVDLVVLTDDVQGVAAALTTAYPPLYPDHWSDDWAAFRTPGPPQVDVVATRPGSWGDTLHVRAWELLRARPDLLDEYRALKATPDDYDERKGAFFERLVSQLS